MQATVGESREPVVRSLIRQQAQARPHAVYLEDARGDRRLTYADLDDLRQHWAAWLTAHSIAPGAAVLVDVDDPIAFAVVHLSLLSSGRCSVPIDPNAPSGDVVRTVAATAPVLVISDRAERADTGGRAFVSVDPQTGRPPAVDPQHEAVPSGAGAVRLSTSGSTGAPKVVHLRDDQLLHVARAIAVHNELTENDRGYNCLPLFHINAQVVGLLSTLVAGATLVLDRRFHRSGFWTLLGEREITWLNAVPAILAILAHEPRPTSNFPHLRFVRSASAPLPDAVRAATEAATGVAVIESYGMTEAGSQITAAPLHAPRRGSAGVPVGVELEVRAAPGGVGPVYIRGRGVITGYVGGRAADRFDADGWLETGDLGYLDEDGYLFLVGRADDVINRGGEMIYPREVEEVLLGDPRVREAVLVAQPHDILGSVPVAYLVPAGPTDHDQLVDDLTQRCVEQLSRFKRPAAFNIVDDLPRASTGKIRRGELRELTPAGAR